MSNSESSTLGPIKDHIANFQWLALALIGLGSCPPILEFFLSVGPPWPHRRAVATFSTVAIWAMMLWTHANWHNAPQGVLKSRVNKFLAATIFCFALFIVLSAFFVVDAPTEDNQIATGFFLRGQWTEILEKGSLPDGSPVPAKTETDLLAANEWNAYALYPAWTVNTIRCLLLGSWIFGFTSLGALTSVYLLLQEKKAASKRQRSGRRAELPS